MAIHFRDISMSTWYLNCQSHCHMVVAIFSLQRQPDFIAGQAGVVEAPEHV